MSCSIAGSSADRKVLGSSEGFDQFVDRGGRAEATLPLSQLSRCCRRSRRGADQLPLEHGVLHFDTALARPRKRTEKVVGMPDVARPLSLVLFFWREETPAGRVPVACRICRLDAAAARSDRGSRRCGRRLGQVVLLDRGSSARPNSGAMIAFSAASAVTRDVIEVAQNLPSPQSPGSASMSRCLLVRPDFSLGIWLRQIIMVPKPATPIV